MSQITCLVVKQYMYYYNKYKKYNNCKFIIVLYFESVQLHYVIYENMTFEQLQREKQNYSSYPTEYKCDNNVYNIFSFSQQNKLNIINILTKYYKVFYIDIDENQIWIEKKECSERAQQYGMLRGLTNKLTNILTDIFYESNQTTEPINCIQTIQQIEPAKPTEPIKPIKPIKPIELTKQIHPKITPQTFQQNKKEVDSLQFVISELVQTKPRVVIHKLGQKNNTTIMANMLNIQNANITTKTQPEDLTQLIDDDNMVLYEEFNIQTLKSTIKTESEKVLRTSKTELIDEFVSYTNNINSAVNIANNEFVKIDRNPFDQHYTDMRFSKKLKFKKN